MHKCFRCLLNPLLLSGLVALGSSVQAAPFSQPKTLFYGLNVTNFSASILQHGLGGQPVTFTHSTADAPELFGDPPNIWGNDSPIIFATLLLSDSEMEVLKVRDQEYVARYGDQLQRQLYISAAGYDAAKNARLSERVIETDPTTWGDRIKSALKFSHLEYLLHIKAEHITELKNASCFDSSDRTDIENCASSWIQGQSSAPSSELLLNTLSKYGCLTQQTTEETMLCADGLVARLSHYQKHKRDISLPTDSVVRSLEDFGCFDESTKAEFYVCSVRWVLEARAGIKIDRPDIVIEQDNQAQSAMANDLMRSNNLPDSRYFFLQATTLAQPYANTPEGILETAPWMSGSLPYEGGNIQAGTLFAEQLKQKLNGKTVKELMNAPDSGVIYAVGRHYNQSLENNDVYIGGNKIQDEEGVYTRILNPDTGRSFAKNQNGALLLSIADPQTESDYQSRTQLTDEQMQLSLEEASAILSEVRDHGAFSLALFIALLEPSFPDGASLAIVGENAEWFANFENKPITDVLRELSQDEDKLDKAFKIYQTLSRTSLKSKTFETFDELNTHPRDSGQHFLYSGMNKPYFKEWLAQLPDRVNNVVFIAKADYDFGLLKAFRARYQIASP